MSSTESEKSWIDELNLFEKMALVKAESGVRSALSWYKFFGINSIIQMSKYGVEKINQEEKPIFYGRAKKLWEKGGKKNIEQIIKNIYKHCIRKSTNIEEKEFCKKQIKSIKKIWAISFKKIVSDLPKDKNQK